jgi:peptide/nickel transport system permease protein
MGRLFQDGLLSLDPNPVMAFFVVIAVFAVIANLLADLLYAVLDPRIRIGG